MKKITIRVLSLLLCITVLLSSLCITAFALSWDGSSTGGGGNTTAATANGYAIRTDGDNVIGYRFSLVNKSGANKVSKVIDVFRNTTYGNSEYTNAYKFNTKYNKKQLINNQNSGYSTSKNSTNCYKEASGGFATALPVASGMETWQNNTTNLNKVLSLLGAGNISGLKNGDKIIVEPIYDLKFQGTYHAVTVTETAIYGKYLLGASSNGGSSSNSGSWGFISNYTNKYYPNQLYTPDGKGLWTGVNAATSRLTFYNIINQGYGVGIAYTETKPDFSPNLAVNYMDVVKQKLLEGQPNYDLYYGHTNGTSFSNWTVTGGYPYIGDSVSFYVCFHSESQDIRVRQYVNHGGNYRTRDVTLSGINTSSMWFNVQFDGSEGSGSQPTVCVENGREFYYIVARQDWIDSNGNVLKYGTEKAFYVPVKPAVTRDKATAYAVDGSVQAYSGSSGSSGAMYFGERVNFKYTYGGKNTWVSNNHLRGQSYRWDGSAWELIYKSGAGEDVYIDNAQLSNTKSYTAASSVGTYTIPLNSNTDENSYKMRFRFRTYWASDINHTGEETNYYLPIVKSDVELADILFVDDDGYYVDENNFEVDDHITVHYVYKNNTNCQVFVKGYNNDNSQITGIYAIPANGSIEVKGYDFTVPNKRTFNIGGSVYLESVSRGDTSYETNGSNNVLSVACHSNHPVTLTPIIPNAAYRENTNVITAFYANNKSSDNYTNDSNLKVRFAVYKPDGTKITTETKNIVVPKKEKNLVYFRWYVSTGLNYASVKITAEIIDKDISYNLCQRDRETIPFLYYTVPDTHYEKEAPAGFKKTNAPQDTESYTTWWEYTCSGSAFIKKYYGIGILKRTPKESWPATGETAKKSNSVWTMKSGYGVSVRDASCMTSVVNYETPDFNKSITNEQYAYALLPEFNYQFGENKCITLEMKIIDSYVNWIFPTIGEIENAHYTPVWYPDGNYDIDIIRSDAWTPMGMLCCNDIISNIKINGNMYDDWYVGRGK